MNPHTFSFDSIGSRFWLERLDNMPFGADLEQKIITYANNFDDSYSRFKDTSLVTDLARKGSLHNPPAELVAMLNYSKKMYEASNGVFNITVGAALHRLGYGKRSYGGNTVINPWDYIIWNTNKVTVPQGLMLDFGGFGKGWMIDAISDILRANGVSQFIVNGGGDMYVSSTTPIEIALEDPRKPRTVLRAINLTNGALAGSDTIKRTWKDGKQTKHHIIDPSTNDSSESGVIASYVTAKTALVADTLATIAIIAPEQKDQLDTQFGAHTLIITN